MCSLCRQIPCHPRCPNVPEPVPIMRCSECGEGIFEGDKYYNTGNGGVCKYCIEDMTAKEFMELIGEIFSTAEKEE